MRKINISELIDFIDASIKDNDVDYITSSWVSSEEIMGEASSNAN